MPNGGGFNGNGLLAKIVGAVVLGFVLFASGALFERLVGTQVIVSRVEVLEQEAVRYDERWERIADFMQSVDRRLGKLEDER